MDQIFRLVVSCPDKVGIVSMVSNLIARHSGSIREANQHSDFADNWFFMRYEITSDTKKFDVNGFRKEFSESAQPFEMTWRLVNSAEKKKVVLMATKEAHCLADLLHRWHSEDMQFDLECVISNHKHLEDMVNWYKVPYYHVPVSAEDKQEAFDQTRKIIADHNADVIVLARYMQIIPPELCREYFGRLINIHHSFLPSFVGAKPYQQAYDRGVKLIGATCHYVTEELDAGPIIEQDVVRVTHRVRQNDMVRLGRDVEKIVLSRGLRYHLEDRVLVHGNKTVVFV
ncbi:MAG: formyltetrahydrofolate deformylase [Gammaproteobacteria bacterium]|nr:MAG: formyltetrahydrofolate deformylase [Gammaproteobacteria bacterium]